MPRYRVRQPQAPKKQSTSAFIRSQPATATAAEVIAAAKAAGVKAPSAAYIHTVRSTARAEAKKTSPKKKPTPKAIKAVEADDELTPRALADGALLSAATLWLSERVRDIVRDEVRQLFVETVKRNRFHEDG